MPHSLHTPATIARPTESALERTVGELDDEHIKHLAALVARTWRRLHRINLSFVLGPILGAAFLHPILAPGIFLLLPLHLIGYLVGRRLVKDEVRSLGYDENTAAMVLKAWSKGQWSITPVFSVVRAEQFLLNALTTARVVAREAACVAQGRLSS